MSLNQKSQHININLKTIELTELYAIKPNISAY